MVTSLKSAVRFQVLIAVPVSVYTKLPLNMIFNSNFTPAALLGACFSLLIWKFVIYPGFISPLAKVPGANWSARFSSLWILWIRHSCRELRTIHESHLRYGPVIRLSPTEVSVNCVEGGIKTVYTGGFDKHEWYANLFDNWG